MNISFRVNKTWISENSIDANTVKLYRWNGSWQALPTSRTGEDENFFYFSAVSPGFSVFAISGERMVEPKKCPPCPGPTPWSECVNGKRTRINYVCSAETNYECKMIVEEEPCEVKEEEKPQPNTIFLFLLALAIITGIVAGILAKKKEVLKRLRARFKKT